jgi:WD40 repeat protein
MIQGVRHNVERHRTHHKSADQNVTEQQLQPQDPQQQFRLKVNRKGPPDFDGLKVMQELNDCTGAIWCMRWSVDGQLLAVAGQDQLLRVYCSSKAWKYFTQLRNKASGQQTSPCSTKDRSFTGSRSNSMSSCDNLSMDATFSPGGINSRLWSEDNTLSEEGPLLLFSAYRGHTADVLDISWSKNHFLLSSSMDKTVRLWHVTRVECLCTLRHADFVTTISFHPKDDRYFLSGSLDGKLRLWNIPDKRVTLWNEVSAVSSQPRASKTQTPGAQTHGLITASAFVQNGKFAVIGTYDGRVIFYSTDQLKYFTQLHVSAKGLVSSALSDPMSSKRGRKRRSNKVTGIECVDENKILVTTNDSRLRLYDLRDLSLVCKYKGCINISSQIRASVSHDNKYIVCGSENSSFFLWRMQENKAIGQRRDKNNMWESVRILPAEKANATAITTTTAASAVAPVAGSSSSGKANPGIITAATFAPAPKYLDDEATYVLAVADFSGVIRLFCR